MRQKPVVRRRRADDDIESAITYYADEAGVTVASDFLDRLEEVLIKISRHPGAGSQRFGQMINIDEMRQWPMQRFPYIVFYVEKKRHIEIVRVLHCVDIPSRLEIGDAESISGSVLEFRTTRIKPHNQNKLKNTIATTNIRTASGRPTLTKSLKR